MYPSGGVFGTREIRENQSARTRERRVTPFSYHMVSAGGVGGNSIGWDFSLESHGGL